MVLSPAHLHPRGHAPCQAPHAPANNQTWVREFILLGLSSDWAPQVALFVLFSVTYLLTLLGNVLIVLLIRLDSRLHTPMYLLLEAKSQISVLACLGFS